MPIPSGRAVRAADEALFRPVTVGEGRCSSTCACLATDDLHEPPGRISHEDVIWRSSSGSSSRWRSWWAAQPCGPAGSPLLIGGDTRGWALRDAHAGAKGAPIDPRRNTVGRSGRSVCSVPCARYHRPARGPHRNGHPGPTSGELHHAGDDGGVPRCLPCAQHGPRGAGGRLDGGGHQGLHGGCRSQVCRRAGGPGRSARGPRPTPERRPDAMWAIVDCAVPVIGAINGPALAPAGLCGLLRHPPGVGQRPVRHDGDQRGPPGCELALVPPVGRHKAREIFFTGEQVSADESYPFGAVCAVVPRAELAGAARALAGSWRRRAHRVAAGQGVDDRVEHLSSRRLPHRTGLHGAPTGLRGRPGGPAGLLGKARARLQWR